MTKFQAFEIMADFFTYRDKNAGEALKITKANGGYYIDFYNQTDRNGQPVSTCSSGPYDSYKEAVNACYRFRPTAERLEYIPFN